MPELYQGALGTSLALFATVVVWAGVLQIKEERQTAAAWVWTAMPLAIVSAIAAFCEIWP